MCGEGGGPKKITHKSVQSHQGFGGHQESQGNPQNAYRDSIIFCNTIELNSQLTDPESGKASSQHRHTNRCGVGLGGHTTFLYCL